MCIAQTGGKAQPHPMIVFLFGKRLAENAVNRHIDPDFKLFLPRQTLHRPIGNRSAFAHIAHGSNAVLDRGFVTLHGRFFLLFGGVVHLSPQKKMRMPPQLSGQLAVNDFHLIHRELFRIRWVGDTEIRHRFCIVHADMPAAMHAMHRMIRRNRIQLFQRRMALFVCEKLRFITHHGDPGAGFSFFHRIANHIQHRHKRRTVFPRRLDHTVRVFHP